MNRTAHGKELILRDDFERKIIGVMNQDPELITRKEAEEYVRELYQPHDYPVLPKNCKEHDPESAAAEVGLSSSGHIRYQTVYYCGNCGVTLVAEADEDGTYWMEEA